VPRGVRLAAALDIAFPTRYFYIMPCPSTFEERTMFFGLTRKSKYVELEKQRDELKAYMSVLTAEMGTLRKEVAELKKDMRASKERTRRLQEETNTLRIQRQGLSDSIEILTKEREIFQKTIQDLCQAVRKQKRTR
jgi:predicted nuclease with TOPRIM domain